MDDDGSFSDMIEMQSIDDALTQKYRSDPSIENYVALRRQIPRKTIDVALLGGFDQILYADNELRRYGINPQLIAQCLDGDTDAISEVSLQLLERLIEANALKNEGGTQLSSRSLIISDKFVDWLIKLILDAMSSTDDLHIPRDLIVLIRERLGGVNSEYKQLGKL